MDFDSFIKIDTLKKREMEYVRMEFESFENLRTIVQQNEKIIELLGKIAGKK